MNIALRRRSGKGLAPFPVAGSGRLFTTLVCSTSSGKPDSKGATSKVSGSATSSHSIAPHSRRTYQKEPNHEADTEATRLWSEPLARQHHARTPKLGDAEALHRHFVGDGADVQPDDLRSRHFEERGLRSRHPGADEERPAARRPVLQTGDRRSAGRGRPVQADP